MKTRVYNRDTVKLTSSYDLLVALTSQQFVGQLDLVQVAS